MLVGLGKKRHFESENLCFSLQTPGKLQVLFCFALVEFRQSGTELSGRNQFICKVILVAEG